MTHIKNMVFPIVKQKIVFLYILISQKSEFEKSSKKEVTILQKSSSYIIIYISSCIIIHYNILHSDLMSTSVF